jgi:twitching motility protein PilU
MNLTPILKMMDEKKASDLFITAGLPPTIKIDGKTVHIGKEALTPEGAMDVVTNMMTPGQREEFDATHECNFAINEPDVGRFRVSAFVQRNQAGAVLRRIETYIPDLEELNLPPILKNLSMTKRGLIARIRSSLCTNTMAASLPSVKWVLTRSPMKRH